MKTPTTILLLCLTAPALAGDKANEPPWTGQYKIKPSETERLTAADIVGPDGIVYPNWTRCGVQGGIPQVTMAAKIEDFGGRADDGQDDSAALDRACEAAGRKGGGAVLLRQGTYHLDWPVTVRHDGVVIRGQGPQKTRLIFRYALPPGGVTFYGLKPGDRIGKATPITLHCRPAGLETMEILADNQTIHQWARSQHSGNGVYAKTASFDHIIRGNVFVLKDPKAAMVQLASPDCSGVEILANQLYGGNGKILSGKAAAGTVEGNQIHHLGDAPRPKPPVPSIYEWQQERGGR